MSPSAKTSLSLQMFTQGDAGITMSRGGLEEPQAQKLGLKPECLIQIENQDFGGSVGLCLCGDIVALWLLWKPLITVLAS